MISRDEFIRKTQEKLEELNAEIDVLTDRAAKATKEARSELLEQLESLKLKEADARQKIEEIKHAGEGALKDMKSGIELAWTAMGEAIDSARSRFK